MNSINPEDALRLRDDAIADYLGPDWDDPASGWKLVQDAPQQARLIRDGDSLDVRVDDQGAVTVRQSFFQPFRLSGRAMAWLSLLASLTLGLLLARLIGFMA